MFELIPLTLNAQAGNNTHAGVNVDNYNSLAVEFVVETAGATPTVTWKVQASADDPSVADGSSNWYDLAYVTDASDTPAVTALTSTAVGAKILFLANPLARRYRKFRVVTSANTNITYHARAFRVGF